MLGQFEVPHEKEDNLDDHLESLNSSKWLSVAKRNEQI